MIDPDTLLRLVDAVPGRHGRVIRLFYGVEGDEYEAAEISRILQVRSRERVLQVIRRVEHQLRLAIGVDPDHPPDSVEFRDLIRAGVLRRKAGLAAPDPPSPPTTPEVDP